MCYGARSYVFSISFCDFPFVHFTEMYKKKCQLIDTLFFLSLPPLFIPLSVIRVPIEPNLILSVYGATNQLYIVLIHLVFHFFSFHLQAAILNYYLRSNHGSITKSWLNFRFYF